MSTYLLTGDGRRLLTGGGDPLMADAPGPAFSELEAAPAVLTVSGSALPVAVVALGAAAALFSVSGTAQASAAATATLEPAVITVSGSAQPVTESTAAGTIRITGTAQSGADAWLEPEPGPITVTGSATPAGVRAVDLAPASIRITGSATGAASDAPLEATPAVIRIAGSAEPSVNTGAKLRAYWLNAYGTRQELLNAIDAANRLLAKTAGDVAQANADAIVLTNAEVARVDGRVTAESERITLLTTDVRDAEDNILAHGQTLDTYGTRITATEDGLESQGHAITQVENAINGVGGADGLLAIQSTVTQHSDEIAANSGLIAATQAALEGKADTSAISSLDAYVRQDVDGRVSANSAAITQVMAETVTPFTSDYGWEFIGNHRGFTAIGGYLESFPVTTNDGATVIAATTSDPQFRSPVIALGGNSHPVVRAMVRRRNAGGWDGVLYWANNSHGFSGSYSKAAPAPPVGQWAVVEWDLRDNADWRSGAINQLRFDFASSSGATVDVKWIAAGNYGQGRAAQATQTMRADVDGVTGKVNASYTIALNANGYHSGVIAQNNGQVSSWRFLSDTFEVFNTTGAGLSWNNGNLWNSRGTYSLITGPDLGEGMLLYIGSTPISPQNARKADAIFYVDNTGTGYFAGRVLQGVLRNRAHNDALGNTTTTTGSLSSNGKPVSLTIKYSYGHTESGSSNPPFSENAVRPSQTVTLTLQRRYGSGSWATLGTYGVAGQIRESVEPGFWSRSTQIGEMLFASDVADTRNREYRVVLSNAPPGSGNARQYVEIVSEE